MDGLPNYLNIHNIDPSRIDRAPGFDSVRPGQGPYKPEPPQPTRSMSMSEAIDCLKTMQIILRCGGLELSMEGAPGNDWLDRAIETVIEAVEANPEL